MRLTEEAQHERDLIVRWLRRNMKDGPEKEFVLLHIRRGKHRDDLVDTDDRPW